MTVGESPERPSKQKGRKKRYVILGLGTIAILAVGALILLTPEKIEPPPPTLALATLAEPTLLTITDDPASQLAPATWDAHAPAWSPDGTRIAFASRQEQIFGTSIYLLNIGCSYPTPLVPDAADPAWSPASAR